MKPVALLITVLILGGCSPTYIQSPLPARHPANPDAPQVTFVISLDNLSSAEADIMAGMQQEEKSEMIQMLVHEESKAALPVETVGPLKQLLDAYFMIGDQLASDTIEEVAEAAKKIGPTVDALVKTEIPQDPHIWHRHANDVRTIRQQAQALAVATDLKTTRSAYGLLSGVIERIIIDTGIPDGYDENIYRYVCGMVEKAPGKGIWLQPGDTPRNPYQDRDIGDCHTELIPMPKDGGIQSDKKSQHDHHSGLGGR